MSAIVEMEGLTKRYGTRTAVDGLTLSIEEGEIFGLLGPNGAGKTTTILMLLGLTEPSEGELRVAGLNPTREAIKVKRVVSYLPENVGFYDDLSALGNLRYMAELNRLRPAEAEERIAKALEAVGLYERAGDKLGTFSRGMRQRLAIADVLIKQPKVAFFDEPTLALDPDGVNQILDLIVGLSRERGMTVMLSSHQLEQVQRICDRVGIFVKGRLVAEGNIEELGLQMAASGGVTIEIGADPDSSELVEALAGVDGVKGVDRSDYERLLLVRCERDIRPALTKMVANVGATLLHLRLQTIGLEQIYFRYFREEA